MFQNIYIFFTKLGFEHFCKISSKKQSWRFYLRAHGEVGRGGCSVAPPWENSKVISTGRFKKFIPTAGNAPIHKMWISDSANHNQDTSSVSKEPIEVSLV